MASPIGTVGAKSNITQGSSADQSFDPSGAQRVTDSHGRYGDMSARGNLYCGANQAAVAVTALNATATGLILTNIVGSGRFLEVINAGVQQALAAATAIDTLQLAAGLLSNTAVTQTTPITVRNGLIGSTATAVGLLASSATLPAAPIAIMGLQSPSVSATATTGVPPANWFDIAGMLTLMPGTSLSFSATTAISCIGHFLWNEYATPTNYA